VRHVILAVGLALLPAATDAQVMEVGATIAAGCLGSDGSACGNGYHTMPAAHASWWMGDRVELSARVARVALPNYRAMTVFPAVVTFEVTDRSREFVSGLFMYHFRRGKAVRPMLGFGSGGYAHSQRVRCEPTACGGIAGVPPEGQRRTWMTDVILAAGVSGNIRSRWVLRGGWLGHRFANDENSAIELFVGAGYRFGTR
jgi:hypothetical protein